MQMQVRSRCEVALARPCCDSEQLPAAAANRFAAAGISGPMTQEHRSYGVDTSAGWPCSTILGSLAIYPRVSMLGR